MDLTIPQVSSELRAGTGCSDITAESSDSPICDRLYARAIVFDDGTIRLGILTMDAVAIGGICDTNDHFLGQLRTRVEAELAIPARHLLVNASHTHPPGRILCGDELLVDRAFDAVRQAAESLVAVRVGAGSAMENRLIMNRNLRLKDGRHWTIRHTNPGPPDDEVAGVEPIDPTIGILRVDRRDGSPMAVLYHFGCHLLFGDIEGGITANFPGIASRLIEDCLGPGVMAFFLQGTAGDVIDVQFKDFGRPRNIEPLGWQLGLSVLQSARKIQTKPGNLDVISEDVEFPRRKDFSSRIQQLRREQADLLDSLRFTSLNFRSFLDLHLRHALNPEYPAADAWGYLQSESVGDRKLTDMDEFNRRQIEKYQANIRAMERLTRIQDELATFARHEEINRSGGATITAEIQGIRIGDMALLAAPLEVLTEVGLNIKASSPLPHTHIAAFSNGYMHYGPPAHAYDKGGYEVIECFLAPEWQNIFEEKAADILRRLASAENSSGAGSCPKAMDASFPEEAS